jgi:hypothetical protein
VQLLLERAAKRCSGFADGETAGNETSDLDHAAADPAPQNSCSGPLGSPVGWPEQAYRTAGLCAGTARRVGYSLPSAQLTPPPCGRVATTDTARDWAAGLLIGTLACTVGALAATHLTAACEDVLPLPPESSCLAVAGKGHVARWQRGSCSAGREHQPDARSSATVSRARLLRVARVSGCSGPMIRCWSVSSCR